jgi:hypothetical protein
MLMSLRGAVLTTKQSKLCQYPDCFAKTARNDKMLSFLGAYTEAINALVPARLPSANNVHPRWWHECSNVPPQS